MGDASRRGEPECRRERHRDAHRRLYVLDHVSLPLFQLEGVVCQQGALQQRVVDSRIGTYGTLAITGSFA